MADPRWSDLSEKLDRLAGLLVDRDLDTLVLSDPANLGWLLGCRVNVPQTLDTACLDIVLHRDPAGLRVTIVTNAIEAPRLQDTELMGLPAEWVVVPWWESRDPLLPSGPEVGADRPRTCTAPVADDVAILRRLLTGRQQAQLRKVSQDAAAAAHAAAGVLEPAMSEYQAAALLARELLVRELDPIVLMVAGAPRMAAHRHPLPTSDPLGRRAMLVACGRRHGLVASVTRIVSFDPLGQAERLAYQRLLLVEEAFLDATTVGGTLGGAFAAGVAAYAQHGFEPDEWHRHHQGGFSGFQPREFPANASSSARLGDGAVVAWNPSGDGWKIEDTSLVLASGAEPLVHDDTWPTIKVGRRRRPDVLVR